MNIYYVEHALTDSEAGAAARILRSTRVPEAQSPIRQRRVPSLFPQPAPGTRPGLRRYAPLLCRHLQRLGLAPRRHEQVAVVLLACSPVNGALAFALREASGLAPYLIVRAQGAGASLRVLDPGSLHDVLDPLDRADPPRRAF